MLAASQSNYKETIVTSFPHIIFTTIVAITLSACSGTPDCESKEASQWFNNKLSPELNQLIAKFVKHAPVNYVLDDIETIKHDKESDSYSCKGILRLHLSNEDNKIFLSFDDAMKKDPSFPQIVENELIAKGSKDNILFPMVLINAAAINNASLRENNENPKEVKYYLDLPVEYSTHKIKSSSDQFQISTDLKIDEAKDLINAHSILFSRLMIAKNLLDHPELIAKIKAEKAGNTAQKN